MAWIVKPVNGSCVFTMLTCACNAAWRGYVGLVRQHCVVVRSGLAWAVSFFWFGLLSSTVIQSLLAVTGRQGSVREEACAMLL